MELNAEQIKKGLKCCSKGTCEGCPYFKKVPCISPLTRKALALINSYEQKIKELTKESEGDAV